MRNIPVFISLAVIIVFSVIVRFKGIEFGLPELLHPDEPFEINRALRLATGSFDWRRAGKGGLYYILFGEMGFTFVYLYLKGIVSGASDFAFWFVQNEHLFYLAGRYTCAILSVVSVFLVYLIGVRLKGRLAGLLAALLLSLCPLAISNAHYSTVDNPLVFFLLCSWFFLIKAVDRDRRQDWFYAALFAAFALITKLPAVVMIFPVGIGLLLRDGSLKKRGKFGFVVFGIFSIVVLIGEPGYFLGFAERMQRYFEMFLPQFNSVDNDLASHIGSSFVAQRSISPPLFYFKGLIAHAGWPVLLLSIPLWFFMLYRRNRGVVLIGAFLFPYLLLISLTNTNLVYSRYLLPVLPLLYLLFCVGVSELFDFFCNNHKLAVSLTLSFTLSAASFLVPVAWASVVKFTLPATQILAQQWIQNHIPDGSVILMEGGREHRSQYTVPLYNDLNNITTMIEDISERDPGKAKYWKLKRSVIAKLSYPRYDLRMVMRHDSWPTLADLRKTGINYFITDKRQFSCPVQKNTGTALMSRMGFYCQVLEDPKITKIHSFYSDEGSWGPSLEIFKIAD